MQPSEDAFQFQGQSPYIGVSLFAGLVHCCPGSARVTYSLSSAAAALVRSFLHDAAAVDDEDLLMLEYNRRSYSSAGIFSPDERKF